MLELTSDCIVVVYTATSADIYGLQFDVDGNILKAIYRINDYTTGAQVSFKLQTVTTIVKTINDYYVVGWVGDGPEGIQSDCYAKALKHYVVTESSRVYQFPTLKIDLTYNYLLTDVFVTPANLVSSSAIRSLSISGLTEGTDFTKTVSYSGYVLTVNVGADLNLLIGKTVTFQLTVVDGTDYAAKYTMTKKATYLQFTYYLEFQVNPTIATTQVS